MRESLWIIQLATEVLKMGGLDEEMRDRVLDIIDLHAHRLELSPLMAEAS